MAIDDLNSGLEPAADAAPQEPEPDLAQTGTAPEGSSSPQSELPGHQAHCGEVVLKRGGAETDVKFSISPPAVIGRFDPSVGPIDVDLAPIPEGSYVSRRHAKLSCTDGVWTLTDLGSSNGTFILRQDFERVAETEIHDGDEFALGNARFTFHVLEVGEPQEA